MVEIKHTISIAYPNGSAKPTMGEMVSFAKKLDSNPADMDTMYRIAEQKAVFIKFKTEASMQYTLMHNPEKLTFHYDNGQAVEVKMSIAGGNVQYVRVYDLPPEVPDTDVKVVLEKYGKVQRVIREKFPPELGLDVYTGVRGIYMDVDKDIPSSLYFHNRRGNIFYSGNKNACFICKDEGHRMNSCPTRKPRKQQGEGQKHDGETKQQDEGQSGTSTYASMVSDGSASLDNEKDTVEEVEVLEKVVEMDETSPDPEKDIGEEQSVVKKQDTPVFKSRTDAYYYHKFGIVDYTEKERVKYEEEQKRLAIWQEEQIRKTRELRERQKLEAKLKSPPRKSKKNS